MNIEEMKEKGTSLTINLSPDDYIELKCALLELMLKSDSLKSKTLYDLDARVCRSAEHHFHQQQDQLRLEDLNLKVAQAKKALNTFTFNK